MQYSVCVRANFSHSSIKMEEIDQEIERNSGSAGKPEGNENQETRPRGSLRTILKQSDGTDMLLMVLGTIGCVADGASMAIIMLVLSNLMNGYAASSLTSEDINKVSKRNQEQY